MPLCMLLACGSSQQVADECLLATIGKEAVTEDDARQLRTLMQPPPSRDEAARLAVATAVAYAAQRGSLQGASAEARLQTYRDFLIELRNEAGAQDGMETAKAALSKMKELEARLSVVHGKCYPGS